MEIKVKSESGNTYKITQTKAGKVQCSCLGFRYHRHCKHFAGLQQLAKVA
jgi:hypothetical protein